MADLRRIFSIEMTAAAAMAGIMGLYKRSKKGLFLLNGKNARVFMRAYIFKKFVCNCKLTEPCGAGIKHTARMTPPTP